MGLRNECNRRSETGIETSEEFLRALKKLERLLTGKDSSCGCGRCGRLKVWMAGFESSSAHLDKKLCSYLVLK